MNHSEMTKHIRNRIKIAGIKASVRKMTTCGSQVISVAVPSFDAEFTADEIEQFTRIAQVNGLTFVRGMEIDPIHQRQLTGRLQWDFYL